MLLPWLVPAGRHGENHSHQELLPKPIWPMHKCGKGTLLPAYDFAPECCLDLLHSDDTYGHLGSSSGGFKIGESISSSNSSGSSSNSNNSKDGNALSSHHHFACLQPHLWRAVRFIRKTQQVGLIFKKASSSGVDFLPSTLFRSGRRPNRRTAS